MIFDLLFRVLISAILNVNSDDGVTEIQVKDAVLASRESVVKNETFVYLYVYHQGPIKLFLQSVSGDADLYISETTLLPSYGVESYDLHSATCGVDVINIPDDFGSPIAVGIYGHPAHETSSFIFEVLKNSPGDIHAFSTITDEIPEMEKSVDKIDDFNDHSNAQTKTGAKIKNKKKGDKFSSKLSGIFSLLELFQLMFL